MDFSDLLHPMSGPLRRPLGSRKQHAGCVALAASLLSLPLAVQAQSTHLYWGDTHLHTSWSPDAYSLGNVNVDPDTAYRFAKGEPVLHPLTRMRVQIAQPLDFLVVADHAEMLHLQKGLEEKDPLLVNTPTGQRLLELFQVNPRQVFREVMKTNSGGGKELMRDLYTEEIRSKSWSLQVDAAERHNRPGTFTTFSGWEWSAMPDGKNLHRVVFTSADGATAKKFIPFSSYDSSRPEDLWQWLQRTHASTGADFIAIPHNSNLSGGLMFATVDSDGRPITAEYARTRMRWEPVMEVTQTKGTSEVHPTLAPNDEFADFEIYQQLLAGTPTEPNAAEYARTALLRGLQIERGTGQNPYAFGLIGSSDSHTGLVSVEEKDFFGKLVVDTLPSVRAAEPKDIPFPAWEMSASGLAAVWSTENTRQAIAAAFERREVYATTGPRIALRVFGGFRFGNAAAKSKDIAALGYERGVPMGGHVARGPRNTAFSLLIQALKDPAGANLDRVQVIKGWLDEEGNTQQRVYDAAWSAGRSKAADGKLQPVGDTVDPAKASYTNTIGAVQLAAVWTDPEFDPARPAFYYVRVLEIPTPRHSVYDAVALQVDPAVTKQPLRIQERAYSSPIWYEP